MPNLVLTVTNALSGQPITGLKVTIYRRTSETTTAWATDATTDGNGRVAFLLGDLGSGAIFFASAKPYGVTATTADIASPADIAFPIGSLEVKLLSGATEAPLAGLAASAREILADGSLLTQASAKTDAEGVLRLDLPGLGAGRTYLIETRSPVDGSTKRSQPITTFGRHTFVVGNAPLQVTLVDAITEQPLAAKRVTVRERLADGSLKWVSAHDTDDQGRTVFDIDGLGLGGIYLLTAKPYDTTTAYSAPITQPGAVVFAVGRVEVKVVDGSEGQPLPNWWIVAKERLESGKLRKLAEGATDDAGVIRFDFEGLDAGRTYILEASSPIDGSTKRSAPITSGVQTFAVGNKPLVVTLRDALNDQVLPGLPVSVYEPVGEDDWRWVNGRETDAEGRVIFDLDGLGDAATGEGQTRSYVLVCEPFNGGSAESDPIARAGVYDFRVGNLEVRLLSGATGAPLPNAQAVAYEVAADGEWTWRRWGQTDDAGVIRFDLPGLGHGRRYVLQAYSPIDNSPKETDLVTESGRIDFIVGNEPLFVTMVNGITGLPVANEEVTVYEILPDGEWEWTTVGTTDESGRVPFDLDGLGDGRAYLLHTCPYETPVHSTPITETGNVLFRVGTVPLRLIDGDGGSALAGAAVTVWEKLPNGELRWTGWAETDANGTILFDLEGVSRTTIVNGVEPQATGRVYVFEASNPFGHDECREYFSPLTDVEGPVDFVIRRGESYPLDLTPPEVAITRPVGGGRVDVAGFVITGVAGDDVRIDTVSVTITDPAVGTTAGTAAYDAATQRWSFNVTPQMVTRGQAITIVARATDQARNRDEATVQVLVVADTGPPQIAVTSHADGAEVEKTGFLLSGVATDDIGVTSLTATLTDPLLGPTIANRSVDVDPDTGIWTLAVLNGQISEGQTIGIELTAADRRGNLTTATRSLHVVGVDFEGYHLISRLTFGSTPALRAEVAAIGADAFVAQQLNPAAIDDSAFDAMIAARPVPASNADLQVYELLHAIHSRRQLREVLTAFWDNHFNTDVNKHRVVAYEVRENDAFRQAALGNFRTLLGISAKSPAMLIYLDNAMSVRTAPNENYARELMELHALSVDGGYTQRDVEQVARAFTGWQVTNGQFAFNAANHDTGVKTVLGRTLAAGRGIEDGEEVLDILATHPSTARFICEKLSRLFVSDTPPAALVSRCAATFLSSGGAITSTVQEILRSPEFADPIHFRAKIKTPVEFIVGVVRNLQAATTATDLLGPMRDMGMRLFENPVPTGWSETGDDWMNSNLLVQRIQFVHAVAGNTSANGTSVQLRTFFTNAGYTTADGIVGFLFHLLFHNDYTAIDREVAMNILTNGGTETFDIAAPQSETRLRRLVATVMSYPGYQFQ